MSDHLPLFASVALEIFSPRPKPSVIFVHEFFKRAIQSLQKYSVLVIEKLIIRQLMNVKREHNLRGSPVTNQHSEIGLLLHDVARLLVRRFEQEARNLGGLNGRQWQAIAFLSQCEGINQTQLADLLEIEPISLVRMLDRLAERGLIERRQNPNDRRTWLLFLKEAASPFLVAAKPLDDAAQSEALSGVFDEDRDRLLQALTLMKTNLTAARRAAVAEKVHHG